MGLPCGSCENMGCGSYHDKCEKYQNWINQRRIDKEEYKKKNGPYRVTAKQDFRISGRTVPIAHCNKK